MSKVKDILGLVVRSTTKKVLGTNVPPMPKAEGTLYFYLRKLKTDIDAAYKALKQRGVVITLPQKAKNLKQIIESMHLPFMQINGNDVFNFGEAVYGDTNNVTDIVDPYTNLGSVTNAWNNVASTKIKSLYPNIKKITYLYDGNIQGVSGSNKSLLPRSTFEEIVICAKEIGVHSNSAVVLGTDSILKRISFPNLTRGGGYYTRLVRYCTALETIELPLYTGKCSQSETYHIEGCDSLQKIELPSLESMYSYYGDVFSNCANLKYVIAPKCVSIGSATNTRTIFYSCPALSKVVFGTITNNTSGQLSNVSLDSLEHLEVGHDTSWIVGLSKWTAANVADDLLNSNFKTYFAERLATKPNGETSTVKYLLTLCQSFYDRLTEENKTILANKGWTIAISE